MKKQFKTSIISFCVVSMALVFILVGQAGAIPALQLYMPGGEYLGDTEIKGVDVTESWFTYDNPFDLVVAGTKQQKTDTQIVDVTLWIAIQKLDFEDNSSGSITVKNSKGDIVTPSGPAQWGKPAPVSQPHGVYEAYYWGYELPDLEIATANEDVYNYDEDYTPENPGDSKKGVLQYYTIEYEDFFWVHMDLTGTVRGKKDKETFAPFSHDADAPTNHAPEPGTLFLLGFGLIGAVGFTRKRFKK